MADQVSDSATTAAAPSSSSSSPSASQNETYNYPLAPAPDIIRSHQKDIYFQSVLLNHLTTLLRPLIGSRALHTYTSELTTTADLLYLSLTTLIGNRTLGEEYCDIIQVEDGTLQLPTVTRRAGYIISCVLLPYGLNKILPSFRQKLRRKLESNLRRSSSSSSSSSSSKTNTRNKTPAKSWSHHLQTYLLTNLTALTSPSPLHALTLTLFYFTGAYYQLSKRLFRLRYIFSKRIDPSDQRVGYEVLGVLLLLQLSVQTYLHLRSTIHDAAAAAQPAAAAIPVPTAPIPGTPAPGSALLDDAGVEVSLDPVAYTPNNEVLFEAAASSAASLAAASSAASLAAASPTKVQTLTRTPVRTGPRYDLKHGATMSWVRGAQQRKCTLCLEELKDPAAVQCGHVFCWECIGDWLREKPACPLCRRAADMQHVLPLRG